MCYLHVHVTILPQMYHKHHNPTKSFKCALIRTTATSVTHWYSSKVHTTQDDRRLYRHGVHSHACVHRPAHKRDYQTEKKSSQCSYVTRGVAYRTALPVAMVTTAVEFLPTVPVARETLLLGYLKTRDLELCTTASTQCYGGKGAGRARTSVTRNLT